MPGGAGARPGVPAARSSSRPRSSAAPRSRRSTCSPRPSCCGTRCDARLSRERLRAEALEPELLAGLWLPHLFAEPVVEVDLRDHSPPPLEDLPTSKAWLDHVERDGKPALDVQNNFVENTVYAGLLVLPL